MKEYKILSPNGEIGQLSDYILALKLNKKKTIESYNNLRRYMADFTTEHTGNFAYYGDNPTRIEVKNPQILDILRKDMKEIMKDAGSKKFPEGIDLILEEIIK